MPLNEQTVTIIVLASLIGGYLLNLAADFLNLKQAGAGLPDEFKGILDAQKYAKSQRYLKTNTRFGCITATFDLLLILIFWFAGGFGYLDNLVRSFNLGPVLSGLIFIGGLMLMKHLVSLPFDIWATFVIEERFGFNKTTPKTFIVDTVKTLILSIVLGGILLGLILGFFEFKKSMAWLWCWIISTLFIIAVQYIVPTWIMPLFNKFEPMEEGPLKKAIMDYADSINFSLSNIFVMDGSKRSSKSNAFFTGFGKNKRIVLYDTLIDSQTQEELVAILAHEMGHYKKHHILKRLVLGIAQMGIIFYLISIFITNQAMFDAFYVQHISVYAGLVFFGMLWAPIDMVVSVAMQIFSRQDEYQADAFAKKSTGTPDHLISALKKLCVHNLSNLTPHPLYVFLNYSHPPVLERIMALKS